MYLGCQVYNGIPRSLLSAPERCFDFFPPFPSTHTAEIDIPLRDSQPHHVYRRTPEVNVTCRNMTEEAMVHDLPSLPHDVLTFTLPVHSMHGRNGKPRWRT
jgi:hypothetical protein